eukprot:COSAG06_NODE_1939_length_8024_cov_83.073186_7_plen_53_part_00
MLARTMLSSAVSDVCVCVYYGCSTMSMSPSYELLSITLLQTKTHDDLQYVLI